MKEYYKDLARYPLLNRNQIEELVEKMRNGDENARERLIYSQLRFVVQTAKWFQGKGFDLADLVAQGNLGLLRAVETYEPSKGAFTTYARYWIRQRIWEMLAEGDFIRIPRYMKEFLQKWYIARAYLTKQLGRNPTTQEICDRLKIKKLSKAKKEALMMKHQIVSDDLQLVQAKVYDQPDYTPQEVRSALTKIDNRYANILCLRFGLDTEKHTLREVGALMGVTRERVRQLETDALNELQQILI